MSHLAFHEFVARPTLTKYRSLRTQVLSSPQYDPQAVLLSRLHTHLELENWGAMVELGESHADDVQLSPRYHFLLGHAYEALESPEGSRVMRARRAFCACLEMLLATGSGASSKPYLPLFVTDINDVLLALRHEGHCREIIQRGTRLLDVVTTADGEQYWFDVTDMMRRSPAPYRQRSTSKV